MPCCTLAHVDAKTGVFHQCLRPARREQRDIREKWGDSRIVESQILLRPKVLWVARILLPIFYNVFYGNMNVVNGILEYPPGQI